MYLTRDSTTLNFLETTDPGKRPPHVGRLATNWFCDLGWPTWRSPTKPGIDLGVAGVLR